MSRHAAPRRRAPRRAPRRSGRSTTPFTVVALVGLAVFLLMPTGGTFAFWSDEGTMRSADFSAGSVDVSLDGNLVGTAANGGTWTQNSFALAAMLPGESKAVSFTVGNAGTTGLTYAIRGSATGALAPALRFSVYVGGTATNTGTAASGNRTGTCAGTALAQNFTLGGVENEVVSQRRTVGAGASETVCVIAKLDSAADNSLQGATGTASFVLDGRQVGV